MRFIQDQKQHLEKNMRQQHFIFLEEPTVSICKIIDNCEKCVNYFKMYLYFTIFDHIAEFYRIYSGTKWLFSKYEKNSNNAKFKIQNFIYFMNGIYL